MSRPTLASVLGFSHLLGRPSGGKPKGSRASEPDDEQDDDKPKGRRAENDDDQDDDKAKGRRAENDDDDQDDKPKGRRAENDDDDKPKDRRAENDDDGDEDDKAKGRRTAAEEDDDEEQDDKDDRDPKARAARDRERTRCAAIFGSRHAAGRVASAAQLAFATRMSAKQAIGMLKTLPTEQAAASGLGARMEGLGTPRPAASAPHRLSGRQAVTSSWDAAATRAGIRKS
jgi:hypothetical protein